MKGSLSIDTQGWCRYSITSDLALELVVGGITGMVAADEVIKLKKSSRLELLAAGGRQSGDAVG